MNLTISTYNPRVYIKEVVNMKSQSILIPAGYLNCFIARGVFLHTVKDGSSDATVRYSKADCDHSASSSISCSR